jgi:hypothetical protein
LAVGSFPIEIAWVGADGQGESHLIRPPLDWMNPDHGFREWSAAGELLHGISLSSLLDDGVPAEHVAHRMAQVLAPSGVRVFCDLLEMDGCWMAKLLDAVGLRQAIPLLDVNLLYRDACLPLLNLAPGAPGEDRQRAEENLSHLARNIVETAEAAERLRPRTRHRALPDAEALWWTWRAIQHEVARRVEAAAAVAEEDDVVPDLDQTMQEGARVGRFVILRDIEGQIHAVAVASVPAMRETEDGTLLMLPGGKLLHVCHPMAQVLTWLDGRHG